MSYISKLHQIANANDSLIIKSKGDNPELTEKPSLWSSPIQWLKWKVFENKYREREIEVVEEYVSKNLKIFNRDDTIYELGNFKNHFKNNALKSKVQSFINDIRRKNLEVNWEDFLFPSKVDPKPYLRSFDKDVENIAINPQGIDLLRLCVKDQEIRKIINSSGKPLSFEIDPRQNAAFQLGKLYLMEGKMIEALDIWKKSDLQGDCHKEAVKMLEGKAYQSKLQKELESAQVFQAINFAYPLPNPTKEYLSEDELNKMKIRAEAELHLIEQLKVKYPYNAENNAAFLLARYYLNNNLEEEAAKYFNQALKLDSRFVESILKEIDKSSIQERAILDLLNQFKLQPNLSPESLNKIEISIQNIVSERDPKTVQEIAKEALNDPRALARLEKTADKQQAQFKRLGDDETLKFLTQPFENADFQLGSISFSKGSISEAINYWSRAPFKDEGVSAALPLIKQLMTNGIDDPTIKTALIIHRDKLTKLFEVWQLSNPETVDLLDTLKKIRPNWKEYLKNWSAVDPKILFLLDDQVEEIRQFSVENPENRQGLGLLEQCSNNQNERLKSKQDGPFLHDLSKNADFQISMHYFLSTLTPNPFAMQFFKKVVKNTDLITLKSLEEIVFTSEFNDYARFEFYKAAVEALRAKNDEKSYQAAAEIQKKLDKPSK